LKASKLTCNFMRHYFFDVVDNCAYSEIIYEYSIANSWECN